MLLLPRSSGHIIQFVVAIILRGLDEADFFIREIIHNFSEKICLRNMIGVEKNNKRIRRVVKRMVYVPCFGTSRFPSGDADDPERLCKRFYLPPIFFSGDETVIQNIHCKIGVIHGERRSYGFLDNFRGLSAYCNKYICGRSMCPITARRVPCIPDCINETKHLPRMKNLADD